MTTNQGESGFTRQVSQKEYAHAFDLAERSFAPIDEVAIRNSSVSNLPFLQQNRQQQFQPKKDNAFLSPFQTIRRNARPHPRLNGYREALSGNPS
jgi:hypothetical protein